MGRGNNRYHRRRRRRQHIIPRSFLPAPFVLSASPITAADRARQGSRDRFSLTAPRTATPLDIDLKKKQKQKNRLTQTAERPSCVRPVCARNQRGGAEKHTTPVVQTQPLHRQRPLVDRLVNTYHSGRKYKERLSINTDTQTPFTFPDRVAVHLSLIHI